MTTLRPTPSLWRRSRTAMLAGLIALGTILAPAGMAVADTGTVAGTSDGTAGAGGDFTWDGGSLADATARVSTPGEELDLRAEPSWDGDVLTAIPDGTIVDLRIDETDTVYDPDGITRWWPVAYGGESGWVAGAYLVDPDEKVPFEFDGGSLSDATAAVDAEAGLRMRSEPSAAAGVLVTIPDGTVVDLRIDDTDTVLDADGVTRWWPVEYDGQSGWVSGFFLASTSGTAASTSVEASADRVRTQFSWDGGSLAGAIAIAAGDGQNVNVRTEPSDSSEIVTKVPDGATINLRIDRVDTVVGPDGDTRWWPVEYNGAEGWVSGYFLTDGTTTTTAQRASNATASDIFPAGSTALVQTRSGGGAKLRAAAGLDAEQTGSVAERSQVTVLAGPVSHENSQNGWFEVRSDSGQTGYIDGDLLVLIATPEAPAAPPESVEVTTTPVPAEIITTPALATEDDEAMSTVAPVTRATEPPETQQPDETPTPVPTSAPADAEDDDEPVQPTPTPTREATEPPASSGSQFVLPVSGAVQTQGFGCSSLGFYPYNPDWGCGVHDGIDFAAPAFTPIVAVADGTVVTAGWCDCGLGYYVEIDHGNNLHTIYGHMATQPYVTVGQQVSQGETIGPIGSTGLSTGPHVHFMVQINGVSQDPGRYLP